MDNNKWTRLHVDFTDFDYKRKKRAKPKNKIISIQICMKNNEPTITFVRRFTDNKVYNIRKYWKRNQICRDIFQEIDDRFVYFSKGDLGISITLYPKSKKRPSKAIKIWIIVFWILYIIGIIYLFNR